MNCWASVGFYTHKCRLGYTYVVVNSGNFPVICQYCPLITSAVNTAIDVLWD